MKCRGIFISHVTRTYLRRLPKVVCCTRIWRAVAEIWNIQLARTFMSLFAKSQCTNDFGLSVQICLHTMRYINTSTKQRLPPQTKYNLSASCHWWCLVLFSLQTQYMRKKKQLSHTMCRTLYEDSHIFVIFIFLYK